MSYRFVCPQCDTEVYKIVNTSEWCPIPSCRSLMVGNKRTKEIPCEESRIIDKNRQQHKKKVKFRTEISNAIKCGDIVRPSVCECCNTTHRYIDGHHEDYDLQYLLVWLCRPCHVRLHQNIT
jgi:hypothetical protein